MLEGIMTNYPADLFATGIGLVVLVVVTLSTVKVTPALPLIDIDGNELEYRDRLGILGFPGRR